MTKSDVSEFRFQPSTLPLPHTSFTYSSAMAPLTTAKVVYSTAGTVSSPIDLTPKGEYESVKLNGTANGTAKAKGKVVSPKVKVTLTSLTINNVGRIFCVGKNLEADDSLGHYAGSTRSSFPLSILRNSTRTC